MKFPRWDRLYYFVFSSMIFAIAAYAVILFVPLIAGTSSIDGEYRKTLLEDGNTSVVLLSLLPIVLTLATLFAVPKHGRPDRAVKINLWFSMFLIYLWVVWTIWSIGILFIPTAILMTAAAVGAMVRRRERTIFSKSPGESKSGRGGGKRRRNRD